MATATLAEQSATRLGRLRKFNLIMGTVHLIQGIMMLLISNDFTLPITTSFLDFDETTESLFASSETLFDIRVAPLVAGFLLLSAVAHFAISVPDGVYNWYQSNLKKGINYARWIEYTFSSSLMIVVVALLFGVYDIATLLLIFTLNATMILFGWVMELHNQTTEKTDWTSFIFGSIAGIVPWIAISIYLVGSGLINGNVPNFVYAIFVSIFLFFNIFAINMILQYKKVGRWRDYIFGEQSYIVLSLVAKSLLAWQVYAGTLQPS